nr:F-box domain, leucine-rich repeat domain, L domain-like protein [Tanacetum cinerariifolium]
MLSKFSSIVNRLYAFIYETNHSKSGLGLPFIVSLDVARSHGGDGGGEDRPPPHYVPSGCGGCFANRGPVPIRFELRDKQTLMPLGEHVAQWSSYIGEVIRGVPLYHPSWLKVPKERNEELIPDIGGSTPASNSTCKKRTIPTRLLSRPSIRGRAQPLRSTRRSLTPFSWHTLLTGNFFGMRIDVYTRRCGGWRLEAMGTYTDDEFNRLARGGKHRGHIPGVGMVLPARATASPSTLAHESTLNCLHKKLDFMTSLFKSDSKYSDMFSQFESGGASGSGGC